MARNRFEDTYIKYECHSCKRCFIVGERLSEHMSLACPYCKSSLIEDVAASGAEPDEDMDLGCLGLYYSLYADGSLMLYTEAEITAALAHCVDGSDSGIPLANVVDCITRYCAERDGRKLVAQAGNAGDGLSASNSIKEVANEPELHA